MNSTFSSNHLSREMIFAVLDDELPAAERLEAETHLAVCAVCRQTLQAMHQFSLEVESAVDSMPIPAMDDVRQRLATGSDSRPIQKPGQHPSKVMRRFGWGMGIAATVAFAISMIPRHYLTPQADLRDLAPVAASAQAASMEVDGETFWPVPYSNADLSTATPHIVQMQVPVSSLADIGIVFEPVTNRVGGGADTERSVLADVLVGADGQPRGIHVIGME